MSADNSQATRMAAFDRLLNSASQDTPLLLFPLRLETHFRISRLSVKRQEKSDVIKILESYRVLLDAFIERGRDSKFSYVPMMANVRRAVEVADSIPVHTVEDLTALGSNVFSQVFSNLGNPKYSAFDLSIRNTLSKATKERVLFVDKAGAFFRGPRNASGDLMDFSAPSDYSPSAQTEPLRLLALIEKWISAIEEESASEEVPLHEDIPSPSPSSGDLPNFPGQAILLNTIEKKNTRELCVRIFPDEIFLDYLTDKLTVKEIKSGKHFWLQWFIASGSRKHEYEAWQVLCDKYPVYRAAWIARQLKPDDVSNFRKDGGNYFYRRPYTKIVELEEACEQIYTDLAEIQLDESLDDINADTGEYMFETNIRNLIGKVKKSLFEIERDIMFCEYIVDYLHDNIRSTVEYLARRIDTFIAFYGKFPGRYAGNNRLMELWDIDHTLLLTFSKEVDNFLVKLSEKHILLDDLIQKYLDDPLHSGFFSFDEAKRTNLSGKPDTPVARIMPDRFVFIGEAKGKEGEKIIHYGRHVNPNLQFGIIEDMDEEPYKITDRGDLEVEGGLAWMVNYDKAEEAGMAITVPLDDSIREGFNYIYVVGVTDAGGKEKEYLHSLFNSHNYTSLGLEMLKPDTPTNIVEGGKPPYDSDPEQEMLRRYEIEVEDVYKKVNQEKWDSRVLSDMLKLDYNECWGHTVKFDNRELSYPGKANKALWTHFRSFLGNDSQDLNTMLTFIGNFVADYVKARGTLPSFRIGSRPYGILPVANFLTLEKNLLMPYKGLNEFLVSLANVWEEIRKEGKVASYETVEVDGKPSNAKFLEMAGLTPYSTTFYERSLLRSNLLPKRKFYPTTFLKPLSDTGYFDALIVGDTEREISFNDEMLAELKGIVKVALPDLADDECELLVAEFFDIFTYRLDAWFSGLLEYLLNQCEYKTPMIGAFGWAFDLEENKRTEVDETERKTIIERMELPQDMRIYRDSTSEYIVAPSIQHALSAAIMRGVYLKTKATDEDSHLCVNLSSMRARQALRMISGVRQGMSTGIILGADLERYLHEAYRTGNEMDQYIYPLRKLFPQTVEIKPEDERAHDYVMNVVNGEALLNTFWDIWRNKKPVADWLEEKYQANKDKTNPEECEECIKWFIYLHQETGIAIRGKHRECLFKLIARMVDSYDALNDLLLAEGVHRLVQGDRATYSAISNFMQKGEGNLPEPAILDTPMEYVVVSNKVALALPQCDNPPKRPMCLAEPSVNLWLEGLMGKLENIWFYVGRTNEDGETDYKPYTLGDLGITPIEYLYLSSNENIFLTYLEARWRLENNCFLDKVQLYADEPVANNENDIFDVDVYNKKGEDDFNLYENELRINRLHSLILRGGTMQANDWIASAVSDAEDEMATDKNDLKERYISLRDNLENLNNEMRSFLKEIKYIEKTKEEDVVEDEVEETGDPYNDETLARMYKLLCRCVESGLINSLPAYNRGMFIYSDETAEYHIHPIIQRLEFDKAIAMQREFVEFFSYVRQQLEKRIFDAEEIVRRTSKELYTSEQYIQAIKKLILDNFKVFPRFTLQHDLPDDKRREYQEILKQGIARYANLNIVVFEEWQSDVAEVREGVKTWHHISMFENMRNRNTGSVSILQTASDGDASLTDWLGCEVNCESKLRDVDSLVIYNSGGIANLKSIAGIIIDAWPEFIPYKKQTAGMVFHCDQPDNEAPQALLLAVHPKFTDNSKVVDMEALEQLSTTPNLIINGDAENGVTGWSIGADPGSGDEVFWRTLKTPDVDNLKLQPQSGSFFFTPEKSGVSSFQRETSLYQDVDISQFAVWIDAGVQTFDFSGWRCADGGKDYAQIHIDILDSAGKKIAYYGDGDRQINSKTWQQYSISNAKLPKNARKIRVTMRAWKHWNLFSQHNYYCVFFDNLQLTMPRFSTPVWTNANKWELDYVLKMLDSTRTMLMNRAVEPDHLYLHNKENSLSTLFPLLSMFSNAPSGNN